MRLWSIHPQYLDRIGLVALWRESLLAQKVLLDQTKGYKAHPQLSRFRTAPDPVPAIGYYLNAVAQEAESRGYRFDRSKIIVAYVVPAINVAAGQIDYEWQRLLHKMQQRSPAMYERHKDLKAVACHPLFHIVPGGIADWERV